MELVRKKERLAGERERESLQLHSLIQTKTRSYSKEIQDEPPQQQPACKKGRTQPIVYFPQCNLHTQSLLRADGEGEEEKASFAGLFHGPVLGAARLKDAKVATADPHFKDQVGRGNLDNRLRLKAEHFTRKIFAN